MKENRNSGMETLAFREERDWLGISIQTARHSIYTKEQKNSTLAQVLEQAVISEIRAAA